MSDFSAKKKAIEALLSFVDGRSAAARKPKAVAVVSERPSLMDDQDEACPDCEAGDCTAHDDDLQEKAQLLLRLLKG